MKHSSHLPPYTEHLTLSLANLKFLKPLVGWYEWMPQTQREQLPVRIANALDSLKELTDGIS